MKIGQKDNWGRVAVKKAYRVTRCESCGEKTRAYVALDMWGNILSTVICKKCQERIDRENAYEARLEDMKKHPSEYIY